MRRSVRGDRSSRGAHPDASAIVRRGWRRIAARTFKRTAAQLVRDFGGLTAYRRSPAHGLWRKGRRIERDDIVVYEVMAARLARRAWRSRRQALERDYRQDSIVIRALRVEHV